MSQTLQTSAALQSVQPAKPLMQLRGLAKAYGAITVLSGVDLDIHAGEIHAIIGENGAGKSTLMRLVSGHVQPTAGTIEFKGQPTTFARPAIAEHAGIVLVHQEILLAEGLTVVENLFLGRELTRHGMVDDRAMEAIAADKLASIGCTAAPRTLVRDLPIAQRQLVQIARALLEEHSLVIFDEPTAVLAATEVETLLQSFTDFATKGLRYSIFHTGSTRSRRWLIVSRCCAMAR